MPQLCGPRYYLCRSVTDMLKYDSSPGFRGGTTAQNPSQSPKPSRHVEASVLVEDMQPDRTYCSPTGSDVIDDACDSLKHVRKAVIRAAP